MKIALLALLLVLPVGLYAQDRKDKVANLQKASLTIKSIRAEGSGVLVVREIDGKEIPFVITAGHVVDSARNLREIVDPKTGAKKTIVEFKDIDVLQEIIKNGRKVGETRMDARIIHYSDADDGHDVAVLMVLNEDFNKASIDFYQEKEIPYVGLTLWHVGSLLGQDGHNSFTGGFMSQIGRIIGKNEYDQTCVPAFPGSSGGGVFNEKGEYVGMLTRGSGETFNYIVPIRRMHVWSKANKFEWLLNPEAKAPSMEELKKMKIEDIGVSFDEAKGKKEFQRKDFKSRFEFESNGQKFNQFLIRLTGPEAEKK